jgi:nitroreductase
MLGWKVTRLESTTTQEINQLLGLTQEKRFSESEIGDMLLAVSPLEVDSSLSIDPLLENMPLFYESIANRLSPAMQEWEIIPQIEDATATTQIPQERAQLNRDFPNPTKESKEVALKRRSIHVMDKVRSFITQEQFFALLSGVCGSLDGKQNAAHLVLFVQRVENFKEGVYVLVRNQRDKESLQNAMHDDFLWQERAFENLYLLEEREAQMIAQAISCSQAIASDGAFSLGMLCNFSEQLERHGAHRYKELYWECGAIGQQLYLDATSMGLSGTGIGCFLDDMFHATLGIKENRFQSLYHFTVGRGYVDSRIQTQSPYEEREL